METTYEITYDTGRAKEIEAILGRDARRFQKSFCDDQGDQYSITFRDGKPVDIMVFFDPHF